MSNSFGNAFSPLRSSGFVDVSSLSMAVARLEADGFAADFVFMGVVGFGAAFPFMGVVSFGGVVVRFFGSAFSFFTDEAAAGFFIHARLVLPARFFFKLTGGASSARAYKASASKDGFLGGALPKCSKHKCSSGAVAVLSQAPSLLAKSLHHKLPILLNAGRHRHSIYIVQ